VKRSPARKKRRGGPRRGRVVDKVYLEWMAGQPCCITGERPVTIHHVRRFGEPKDDHRTIPLVARLHMLTNETPGEPCVERGKEVFQTSWDVDIEEQVHLHRERFFKGAVRMQDTRKPVKLVEVARSFSFKLNLGNYQSADFFCSQKAQCHGKDAATTSAALYRFCKSEVVKAVEEYRKDYAEMMELNKR